jgi:hypothetical protein
MQLLCDDATRKKEKGKRKENAREITLVTETDVRKREREKLAEMLPPSRGVAPR